MADINDRLERLHRRDELARRVLAQRAVPEPVAEEWIAGLNPTAHSLAFLYGLNKSREQTYNEMAEVVVRRGRRPRSRLAAGPWP